MTQFAVKRAFKYNMHRLFCVEDLSNIIAIFCINRSDFVFFNVYDKPLNKILWLAGILAGRIALFSFSQQNPAAYRMAAEANTIYQTVNTVAFFLMLAGMCIIFSTSIQDTERQLRLKNQTVPFSRWL